MKTEKVPTTVFALVTTTITAFFFCQKTYIATLKDKLFLQKGIFQSSHQLFMKSLLAEGVKVKACALTLSRIRICTA